MKYLCLVYDDEATVTDPFGSPCDALAGEILDFDEELRLGGRHVASSSLVPGQPATTIRVHNGRLSVSDSYCAASRDRLNGFYVIEARDLNDAIRIVARMPPARLGCVEVRPVKAFSAG
jgi:hypothetical protein